MRIFSKNCVAAKNAALIHCFEGYENSQVGPTECGSMERKSGVKTNQLNPAAAAAARGFRDIISSIARQTNLILVRDLQQN
jgi:hypothetical protein